jgi:hypothetical protein
VIVIVAVQQNQSRVGLQVIVQQFVQIPLQQVVVQVQLHHHQVDEAHHTHILGILELIEVVVKHVDDEHKLEQ